MLSSTSVYEDPNYPLAMEYINKIKNKTNIKLGSVQLGIKYATFYFDKINEMLISEYVDIQILNELKEQVQKDYEIIINDCKQRINPEREDVKDNKYMISIILDFILTLKI